MSIQKEIIREVKIYIGTLVAEDNYSNGLKFFCEDREAMQKLTDLFLDYEFKVLKDPDRSYSDPKTPKCFYSESLRLATEVTSIDLHRSRLEAEATHRVNIDLYEKGLLKSKKKKSDD